MSYLKSVLLCLFFPLLIQANLVVSEIMGDPVFAGDSDGEYVELVNTSNSILSLDSSIVINNQDSLRISNTSLQPKGIWLICRDSVFMRSINQECNQEWTSLSLSNQNPVNLILLRGSYADTFRTEPPLSGKSWENLLDSTSSFKSFTVASQSWQNTDFGSPGFLHSGIQLPFLHDAALTQIYLDTSDHNNPFFEITIENKGINPIPEVQLSVNLDENWDKRPERKLDEVTVSLKNTSLVTYHWPIPKETNGVYVFSTEKDENPTNNTMDLFYPLPASLQITELCPYPSEDAPEWFELKNTSSYTLSLSKVSYNAIPLTTNEHFQLRPGEYVIFTADSALFRSFHNSLKLNLFELPSWDALRNSGDSVGLFFEGTVIYHVSYPSLATSAKGRCLIEGQEEWILTPDTDSDNQESSTPGYEAKEIDHFAWKLSAKTLDISKPQQYISFSLDFPPGETGTVEIFNLSGFLLRSICKDCMGQNNISWYGRDDNGRLLQIGPYIALIKTNRGTVEKKVIVLVKPL
ncbi:MAG: hypothetical protein HQK83_11040 [Fibrobacteria bacterium]|nr:hypothetical protein [Fibrobacteria bacterium]